MRSLPLLILDAMITAPARPRSALLEHVQRIIRPATRKSERVALGVDLIDRVVPGTSALLCDLIFRRAKLPLCYSSLKVLGYGSGDTVFLLEGSGKRFVLKVHRESLGKTREEMLHLVRLRKTAFEAVASQFTRRSNIIIPTHFVIIEGPLLGQPVAAALQEFIESEKKDLYEYSDDELAQLLSNDHRLKSQLAWFVQNTRAALVEGGFVIDLLGRENLMLVRDSAGLKLLSADTGMMNSAVMKRTEPDKYARYAECVERFGRVLRSAEINTSVEYEHYSHRSLTTDAASD